MYLLLPLLRNHGQQDLCTHRFSRRKVPALSVEVVEQLTTKARIKLPIRNYNVNSGKYFVLEDPLSHLQNENNRYPQEL
jgi:hypothetical protein